jgi:hypothetical protein
MDDTKKLVPYENSETKNFFDRAHRLTEDAKEFANSANDLMETMIDGGTEFRKMVNSLIEYKTTEQVTKREMKKYETMIHTIDTYRDAFLQLFGQRQQSIEKFFEVIDKGMVENNLELITQGLLNLSFLVASSPFKDIGELRLAIESNQEIVL